MTERLSTARKNEYGLLRTGLFKGYLVVIKNTTSEQTLRPHSMSSLVIPYSPYCAFLQGRPDTETIPMLQKDEFLHY